MYDYVQHIIFYTITFMCLHFILIHKIVDQIIFIIFHILGQYWSFFHQVFIFQRRFMDIMFLKLLLEHYRGQKQFSCIKVQHCPMV